MSSSSTPPPPPPPAVELPVSTSPTGEKEDPRVTWFTSPNLRSLLKLITYDSPEVEGTFSCGVISELITNATTPKGKTRKK